MVEFLSTPDGKKFGLEAFKNVNKVSDEPIIDLSTPESVKKFNINRFTTSLPSFNYLLSGRYDGGIPLGRILEVVGFESVGKTTLLLQILGDFWKVKDSNGNSPRILYIDAEASLSPEYAAVFGIDVSDTSRFLYTQPESAEEALDLMEQMAKYRAVDVIVLDSIAALATQEENEKGMNDSSMATLARKLSTHLRKANKHYAKNRVTVLIINQFRTKLAAGRAFGKTEIGGNALKFYTSIKIEMSRSGGDNRSIILGRDQQIIGSRILLKTIKNKTHIPQMEVEMDLIYGQGFSVVRDIINIAIRKEIITKRGNWLKYKDLSLGNGIYAAFEFLEGSPDVLKQIKQDIQENEK